MVCPEGNHAKITEFASTRKHGENAPFCTQTWTEEAEREYEGLTATDNTNGTPELVGTVSSLKLDSSGSFPCPNSTTESAPLEVHAAVTGENAEGGSTEIGISHF